MDHRRGRDSGRERCGPRLRPVPAGPDLAALVTLRTATPHAAAATDRLRHLLPIGRPLVVVVVVLVTLLTNAAPAGADPARPTDYRSRILSVRPALPAGVDLGVVGGDAFLELRVTGDHTVVVPDYTSGDDTEPRPYLRFGPDGTVELNERSAAAVANESRYGTSTATSDIGTEPRWKVVSHDGRHVWHDHRIHWMLPRPPTAIDADRRVDLGGQNGTWTVDLTVDGKPVSVRGELLLLPPPSPFPWLAVVVALGGAVLGLAAAGGQGGGQPAYRAIAGLLVVAGGLGTVIGWAQWPARRRRQPAHGDRPGGGCPRRTGRGGGAGCPDPAGRPGRSRRGPRRVGGAAPRSPPAGRPAHHAPLRRGPGRHRRRPGPGAGHVRRFGVASPGRPPLGVRGTGSSAVQAEATSGSALMRSCQCEASAIAVA